jgi:hypothetical protein
MVGTDKILVLLFAEVVFKVHPRYVKVMGIRGVFKEEQTSQGLGKISGVQLDGRDFIKCSASRKLDRKTEAEAKLKERCTHWLDSGDIQNEQNRNMYLAEGPRKLRKLSPTRGGSEVPKILPALLTMDQTLGRVEGVGLGWSRPTWTAWGHQCVHPHPCHSCRMERLHMAASNLRFSHFEYQEISLWNFSLEITPLL